MILQIVALVAEIGRKTEPNTKRKGLIPKRVHWVGCTEACNPPALGCGDSDCVSGARKWKGYQAAGIRNSRNETFCFVSERGHLLDFGPKSWVFGRHVPIMKEIEAEPSRKPPRRLKGTIDVAFLQKACYTFIFL